MKALPKVYGLMLLSSVFSFLVLPLIGLREEAISERENRALAQRPSWQGSWSDLPNLAQDWEAYFNDQYGFRSEAIRVSEGIWERLGLAAPPMVVRGREGWLFLGGAGAISPLRDLAGVNRLSEAALEQWRRRLEARHELVASAGARYAFLIAPNKSEIYDRYLPAKYRRRKGASRREQLVAHLRHFSSIPILDASEAMGPLRRGESALLGYSKSGTHWNAFGAGLAQNILAHWLAQVFPTLQPQLYSETNFELLPVGVDLDLARLLGIEQRYGELAPMPREPLPAFEREPARIDGLELERGQTAEFFRFHGDGSLRFVVFGDSFFENLVPFLGQYFGSGLFVPAMPSDEQLRVVLDAYGADVVLEQRVERFLGLTPVER